MSVIETPPRSSRFRCLPVWPTRAEMQRLRTDVYNKNWTRLDHMTGDLHPHGQNSPDIPMSSIQNFFTLQFHFRRDIGMAGAETTPNTRLR